MKTIKQSDTETVLPCMQPHRALPVHEPYRVRIDVRAWSIAQTRVGAAHTPRAW
jgi:hypothetical protein